MFSIPAGEEKNFFLHCFTFFLEDGGEKENLD